MLINFSPIDTDIFVRMALFFGVTAAGSIIFPLLSGGMLKIIKMLFFIVRFGVAFAGLG